MTPQYPKLRWLFPPVALAVSIAMIAAAAALAGEPARNRKRPPIYDPKADGNRQIADALRLAKRDHRNVLLQFGHNRCPWCFKLHDLFEQNADIKAILADEYVLVLIDCDQIKGKLRNAEISERYGNPVRLGYPVLVVLDPDGKQLTTQETGSLEKGDAHDPEKVLAFLKKWQPRPMSADDALTAALARAKAENKRVFVHFGAPWCGWCHKLEDYLARENVAKLMGRVYVDLKIDVDRMTGGKELDKKLRGKPGGGIPFIAILDSDGKKLADSFGPKGNIGFPTAPAEIERFALIIRQTAPTLTDEDLQTLTNPLKSAYSPRAP